LTGEVDRLALPMSVLDLAPVADNSSVRAALRNTIDLAQRVERLGFGRFWVAEHHNMPGIASSAPAVLLGHIAAATSTIRVGSGGVMLPNHAPLVVAEQFGMLEALHPGRVDLGLGRAPGTDRVTAYALRRSVEALSADEFPTALGELFGFFSGAFPDGHPFQRVTAVPGAGHEPAIWLLGSSGYSAQVAGALGLPFAFAHHFSGENTVAALQRYRESFTPGRGLAEPYAMISVNTLAAETDERARYLSGAQLLAFLWLRQGRPSRLPSPAEAAAYAYSQPEREFADERLASQAIGSPATVRRRLGELVDATGADELMLVCTTYDHADRIRSFELVASEVADLSPAPVH
jgi:luciferase family oxidoreductase group 1